VEFPLALSQRLAILRDARWFGPERARAYALILAVAQCAGLAVFVGLSSHGADARGEPLGTDFVSFWTAARLALGGQPSMAYDPVAHQAAEHAMFPGFEGWYAFFYPPVFLLYSLPLALAPYFVALALWLTATGAAFAQVVRQIAARRIGLIPILAFPAVFTNIGHGQNAFLTTALFGAGINFLGRRPVLAGMFFGGLAYKPQLAFIIPLGLAAAGRWRAFFSMGATALVLAALSFAAFGETTWSAFLAEATIARQTLEQGLVGPEKMQSLFAALRLLGASLGAAYALQAMLTGCVCLVLVVSLRKMEDAVAQGALMAAAALLVTPFVLDYDLALLALPLAFLLSQALQTGFRPWEKITLMTAFVLPAVSRALAEHAHLPLAPAVLLLFFLVLARRVAPAPVFAASPA
jgi:hypothetical protein